ncbi:hypothetical protein AB4Z22_24805, partial [Paenibacillus sp. TAF58]
MRTKLLMFILTVILLQTAIPFAYAESGKIDVWVVDPLKTVYRTSNIPQNPSTSINLVSAKNEYESDQIAVRSNIGFEISGIEFSDLISLGSGIIPSSNLSYHFEEYELTDTVQPNLFFPDRVGDPIYPQTEIPDPLSNEPSIHVAANSTQPIYITNYVPSDTTPGNYQGTVTVKTALGNYIVPINVEVVNAEIPKTSEANFVNYQWTMTNG